MPLECLVVWRLAFVPPVVVVAADELVAEHFAGHFGVAAAELLLVAAHAIELVLVVAVHVLAVHSDGFAAGPVVGGELS